MKIGSIKTLTFWFVLLGVINSNGILPAHCGNVKHHDHHHSHHRKLTKCCKLPFANKSFADFYSRITVDLHSQGRDPSILYTAEAFNPHPISVIFDLSTNPPTVIVTDPHIAELIQAVNTHSAIGRNDLIAIFEAFGLDATAFANSLLSLIIAGEQYSIVVVNSEPSNLYLIDWFNAAAVSGKELARLLEFKAGTSAYKELLGLFEMIVDNQSKAILGLNQLLPGSDLLPEETQSDAAMRFLGLAHAAIEEISLIIAEQLVVNFNNSSCKACDKYTSL